MELDKMSKDELEMAQVQVEAELKQEGENSMVVEMALNDIGRQIDTLRLKSRDLKDSLTKSKTNLRRIHSDLRAIKVMIYRRLNGL